MNLKQFLSAYNRIVIPRIQRDYAQGRQDNKAYEVRSNLLRDLFTREDVSFNMIFGESTEDNEYIPIDGQQRLTMLFLLALYGHKILGKEDVGLKKLHYATRESSSEFWDFIINENWSTLSQTQTVSDWCKNLNGFQWYWSMDPTVQSMINVLNDIHRKYIQSPEHFPNILSIEFDNHDMTKSGLNETLYIKMNSRGKHLNPFEQIKSAFDAIVSDNTNCYDTSVFDNYPWDIKTHEALPFAKKWSYCMDRDWSNFFWDEITASLDGTILKLILGYTYVFLTCRDDYKDFEGSLIERRKDEILSLIKKSSSEILSYNNDVNPQFSHISAAFSILKDKYNLVEDSSLRQEYLEGLATLLSRLVQANCSFSSSWGDNIDFRNPELKYENKILGILASLIYYNGDGFFGKDFNNWMRFCWNMVENTIQDNEGFTNYSRNCKKFYSQGSTHILIWLESPYSQFPQRRSEQFEEEIFKASFNIDFIKKVESHILLKGRIRPLLLDESGALSFNGLSDRYNNFISMFDLNGDVVEPVQFIKDYIMCADTQKAMSYHNNSEWSVFRTSANAIKSKFNDHVYDSVWPNLFETPLGHKKLLQRNPNQIAELHIREQLLIPGFIEAILSSDLWLKSKPRIRWYYGTYFLYPSDKRSDGYFIMLDWYGNGNDEWNRKAIHLLNQLQGQGIVQINTKRTKPLIHREDNTIPFNFWIGKDLWFYYKDKEFKLSKDYNLCRMDTESDDNKITLIGVNRASELVSILDKLLD